jgi:hypothetical protein
MFVFLCVLAVYLAGVSAVSIVWLLQDVRRDTERDPSPALWWPVLLWRWVTGR